MARPIDFLLASAAGVTLAVMIELNSQLAARSSAIFASWVAHGVGAVAALLLVVAASRAARGRISATADRTPRPPEQFQQKCVAVLRPELRKKQELENFRDSEKSGSAPAPLWAYLGGIPGAFTVVLASVAVNGGLTLSTTLALMLVGQMMFGLASDRFGWFGLVRRRLGAGDLLGALALLCGSAILLLEGRMS